MRGKTERSTGTELAIPVDTKLREIIDATPSGHLTFLVTEFGKPVAVARFGNWFREQCDMANLQLCVSRPAQGCISSACGKRMYAARDCGDHRSRKSERDCSIHRYDRPQAAGEVGNGEDEKENIQCLSLIELDTFRQKTLKNQSAKIEVAPAGLARAN